MFPKKSGFVIDKSFVFWFYFCIGECLSPICIFLLLILMKLFLSIRSPVGFTFIYLCFF
ncbi:hypothetical protein Ahy_A01g003943 isoform C [Arachis hypogaea]|uniref:Uncharacterized protein n=1 Tax=Arachis hypogaea TaxID=3818 RepID=A0A445EUC3_ARAHY|nr:hypothetical protein Ahy_A01g003943 isoform C [Arachis hypogaea]